MRIFKNDVCMSRFLPGVKQSMNFKLFDDWLDTDGSPVGVIRYHDRLLAEFFVTHRPEDPHKYLQAALYDPVEDTDFCISLQADEAIELANEILRVFSAQQQTP